MKKIVLWCFALVLCFGDLLDDKIHELIGVDSYSINKSFVDMIFKNRQQFYLNGEINIPLVIKELKNNGLIVLKFPSPLDLNISFISQTSPILLVYTINNVLSSMGYSYYIVTRSSFVDGISNVQFSLVTEHSIDPTILIGELQKRGFRLIDIKRKNINDWEYLVESQNPQLFNAKQITLGNALSLREVSGEYWISIPQSGNLQLNANPKWTPRIVCYDKDLQIVNLIIKNTPTAEVNLTLDDRVRFVMITDALNPNIIKDKLEVMLLNF